MNFDFQAILLLVTLFTGVIWLLDVLVWQKKREALAGNSDVEVKLPVVIDYSRSFFPILLAVLILRSFLVEPFRIPSGSMEPTLYPGDFILVNKFSYGVRMPLFETKLANIGKPDRGDVVVFRYPEDPSLDYIKRVVGLPGDEVVMRGQRLWVNGERVRQVDQGLYAGQDTRLIARGARVMKENLAPEAHRIAVTLEEGVFRGQRLRFNVPKGHYFVMGDNRDNSNDSRFWGFVPQDNLVGKAFMIWMSWNGNEKSVQWHRIGEKIQ